MANTTMDATAAAVPNTKQDEGQSSELLPKKEESQDARFSCNICFDAVTEPVVTRCGHLYCWPCLYRWLAPGMTNEERASLGMARMLTPLNRGRRCCPVCKSECSVPTVVPIYVRNDATPVNASANVTTHNRQEPLRPMETVDVEHREEEPRSPNRMHIPPNNSSGNMSDLNSFENMGLDIDGDDLGLDIDHNPPNVIPTTVNTDTGINISLGLRQRRGNESRDESNNTEMVPTRPTPSRDRAATAESNMSSSPGRTLVRTHSPVIDNGPTPNHHARATLSYGLVLAMHQTLLNATSDTPANNSNNNSNHTSPGEQQPTESIPSLHYPHQRRDSDDVVDWDQDPASTVFLSRLLLGLSLFVLFCLLSF